ncbi:hypothetical protein [Allochromatium vinosum]|uniref:Uncharacterized protein n=1 Tax=Allochromatium vinosum (strain ATCC 17899 / DSM 180 / NBRC 103801 / NCIMB 10441 / D) TaxID=572477 RepID=D3RSI5_ALLVD|nr:hypothetical protein [Allochromatium vinosum]ADC62144.1 conserved hypothetical protein [Allochromatium vinosum DSM 180]
MNARLTDRFSLQHHIEHSALTAAAPLLEDLRTKPGLIFRLGIKSAPLFVGQALFIAEQSIIDDVEAIYFFTREGEFFERVFASVVPNGRLANHRLPNSRLLEVSRLATFSASLRTVSLDEMRRLWSLYDSQSLFALARSLGLEPQALEPICARHGLPLAETIVHPWLDVRVKALFTDPVFVRFVSDKIAADRRAALSYFAQQGLVDGRGPFGLVDIGWRGTIQDNLALLLPNTRFFGYYLGLQRFLNPQPPNGLKRAYGPDANLSLFFSHLLDAVSPMEMLCNSPHGSVMGYRLEGGGAHALRLSEPTENTVHAEVVRHFQDGVLFACRHWAPHVEAHSIRSQDLREQACQLWNDLIERPDRQVSEAYAALKHNDVFGVGGFVDKRVVPSPWRMIRGIVSPEDRRAVILYIKQTQWSSGLWQRRDLRPVHRLMLIAALTLGRTYKHLRMWMHYHLVTRR